MTLIFFLTYERMLRSKKKILAQIIQSLEQLSEKEDRFFLVHDYAFY